ncbi:hypothetical protein N7470_000837 [Penicillium chermesinum]|nr:hypothetical protein N7470_000837 [Penicillium chermesinum]
MPSQVAGGQNLFASNPEDMIMRYGHQFSHQAHATPLDQGMRDTQSMMSRPDDFGTHSMHGHSLSHHSLPSEMASNGMSSVPVPQYQPMYDSGMEHHQADQTLDEDASEHGGKKKRGSSSTLANDNELRKMLRQYEGYSLKQMAAEVMKHEGAGGKAEKVKQVFAMIWLRENCRKSNSSVRRDRVYCCYAEKCGTERVSVLNPASFGKLVRIIFPNVQTRRLGVRGESKYHYVDLSVIEEKQHKPAPSTIQVAPSQVPERPASALRSRSISIPQPAADTAVFPSPSASFAPRFPTNSPTMDSCGCHPDPQAVLHGPDAPITVENVSQQSAKIIHQMLQFPTDEQSLVSNAELVLPDIRPYLPANSDLKVAEALAALYRSNCISVIDSFRFCKERNLMKYLSSFHGTLTVPVQKLLTHPSLAPWIKECDWTMYQKMIPFVAPLTTQIVPQQVLDAFRSISQKLCGHIAETFKTQPAHVSIARLVPAHIFCKLLKHMLDVNQAANAAAAWLSDISTRSQMWQDFQELVDPTEMIAKANIPTCAARATEQILKHDVRALLTPIHDPVTNSHPFFAKPDTPEDTKAHTHPVENAEGIDYNNFPDKWISFILNLSPVFNHHRSQCIIKQVDALARWIHVPHPFLVGTCEFCPPPMAMGSFQIKRDGAEHASFDVSTDSQTKPQNGSSSNRGAVPSANDEIHSNKNHSSQKDIPIADTGFQAPNNDDSAIDLEDDPMMIPVGKYGDMMASDPADAEGDVVVI